VIPASGYVKITHNCEFFSQGQTVNQDYNMTESRNCFLCHDNSPVHCALYVLELLAKNKINVLFDVHVTVHCRYSEGKEPTRCNNVCSFIA
jgi:hypothetical protein